MARRKRLDKTTRDALNLWWAEKTADELSDMSVRDFFDIGMCGITGAVDFSDTVIAIEYELYMDMRDVEREDWPIQI